MLRELGSSPDRVTITGGPHDGATGVVVARRENGALEVQLDSGETIVLPGRETAAAPLPRECGS